MSKDKHTSKQAYTLGGSASMFTPVEYWQYHSWQFGVSIDAINGYDRYVDIEAKNIVCRHWHTVYMD